MGKKKKTSINYVFANNLPEKVEEPVQEETAPEETPVEETKEEPKPPVIAPVIVAPSNDPTKVNYPPLTYPAGTPDTGILLCIILSLITLVSLGFLIWHERSWRQEEEQNTDVQVDDTYSTLTTVVKNYVATIRDPKKAEYCVQLKAIYYDASRASNDISQIEAIILAKSRNVLSFDDRNKPEEEVAYEYEWQRLFGSTGVINNYLSMANIVVTKDNQKDVFTAIAKGLE